MKMFMSVVAGSRRSVRHRRADVITFAGAHSCSSSSARRRSLSSRRCVVCLSTGSCAWLPASSWLSLRMMSCWSRVTSSSSCSCCLLRLLHEQNHGQFRGTWLQLSLHQLLGMWVHGGSVTQLRAPDEEAGACVVVVVGACVIVMVVGEAWAVVVVVSSSIDSSLPESPPARHQHC